MRSVDPQVALVNMPFAATNRPSLGLGLLKAGLARRGPSGIPCTVHYPNVWFAELVPTRVLVALVSGYPEDRNLVSEWLFSRALWGDSPARDERYLAEICGGEAGLAADGLLREMIACRPLVEPFLERCLAEIPWQRYRIVGFTSMFQQQVSSLALARRLKERFPELAIVFGGANCEGEMGRALFESFDFVDAVCSGEGDEVFPELAAALLEGRPVPALPGIVHRLRRAEPAANSADTADTGENGNGIARLVKDLDALPFPDFDDFFAALDAARLPADHDPPRFLFEMSRGCWWGEKSHCTFCGLNGLGMAFRRKSPERVLAELDWLVGRYGDRTKAASATDNILPPEYFETLFPRLAERDLGLQLFVETKTNLTEEQVGLLRRAGVRIIQPGIESLSTAAARAMKKGTTLLENVQLLKWSRQYGLEVSWNYLTEFPGETEEQLADGADLIGRLRHLPPPSGLESIHFDRFSPYTEEPDRFGIRDLTPCPAYRFVYPDVPDSRIRRLAYYFTGTVASSVGAAEARGEVRQAIEEWRENRKRYALFTVPVDDKTLVCDFRGLAEPRFTLLAGRQAELHAACRRIRSISHLVRTGPAGTERLLDELFDLGLLLREGDRCLALAVPLGYRYSPPPEIVVQLKKSIGRAFSPAGVAPEPQPRASP